MSVEVTRPQPAVAVVTLARPEKRNALSIAVRDAVSDALDALAADEDVKVVVITGQGTHFSAGFDLKEFADTDAEHQRRLWASSDRFHHTILSFPLPTIAAVNGPALAGGCDLACMTDIRIAVPTAHFGHPEHAWSPVVYRPLRDLIGGAAAREFLLTGRDMHMDEAVRIGLVAAVVPEDELMERALAEAALVARAPRSALVSLRARIQRAAGIHAGTATLEL